ncbi:MAG TPA: radical SAM protein [Candidatus Ozemobacteraceae bacterium]
MSRIALVSVPTMTESYHSLQYFIAIPYPVSFLTMAATLEQAGHEVLLYDAEARGSDFAKTVADVLSFDPDVVGVTAMTPTVMQAGRFCDAIKAVRPTTRIVLGGVHATALPERTLAEFPAVDAIVKGEGEYILPQLVGAWGVGTPLDEIPGLSWRESGGVRSTPQPPPIRPLDELPLPAYHLLDGQRYRSYGWNAWNAGVRSPMASIFTSRGCYRQCTFCASGTTLGHGIRYHGVDRVLEEIDQLVHRHHIRILYINDDTFAAHPKRAAAICEGIIKRGYNLSIMISARCDEADPELFKLMHRAGVDWCFFGIESGNQQVLDRVNKGITLEQIDTALRIAGRAGIHIGGNFILGLPGETAETIRETIRLALRYPMEYASFAICLPFPGSALYEQIKDRPDLPDWSGFRLTNARPIPLGELSPEELQAWRFRATLSFFARPSYLLRLLKRFNRRVIIEDFARMGLDVLWERLQKRY